MNAQAPHIRQWNILPLSHCNVDQVQTYWQTLHMYDTLQYRLCDMVSPSWEDVKDMIVRMGQGMYCVFEDNKIVSEFALEHFTGHSAQVHFSMHPDNSAKQNLRIAREVTDDILALWKRKDDEPFLRSIYGLTPVTNRVACIFVQKVGFKKIGILPGGISDRGKVVDAMITIKAR